jgi:hypothetical protein
MHSKVLIVYQAVYLKAIKFFCSLIDHFLLAIIIGLNDRFKIKIKK